MPSGSMTAPAGVSAGALAGEMPRGEMNGSPSASATAAPDEDADSQTLEIPGDWRLILKRKQ
jgi:hypothetical protein